MLCYDDDGDVNDDVVDDVDDDKDPAPRCQQIPEDHISVSTWQEVGEDSLIRAMTRENYPGRKLFAMSWPKMYAAHCSSDFGQL